MRLYRADMHIHTCLSPCGDLAMDPFRVVRRAVEEGVDLMVVSDHNTTRNCRAVMEAAQKEGVTVLPGCEVCTAEEIHLVALVEDLEAADLFQGYLSRHLTGKNAPEAFGYQIVADAHGNFLEECTDFLLGALSQSAAQVITEVHRLEGLIICAHIDRRSFSVVSQLGFIPGGFCADAVEVTHSGLMKGFAREHGAGLPVVTASDAHHLEDIGHCVTVMAMEKPSFKELAMALRCEKGRKIMGYEPVLDGAMQEAM